MYSSRHLLFVSLFSLKLLLLLLPADNITGSSFLPRSLRSEVSFLLGISLVAAEDDDVVEFLLLLILLLEPPRGPR